MSSTPSPAQYDLAEILAQRAARHDRWPTEADALEALRDLHNRLAEFGWQDIATAPKSGEAIETIFLGSKRIERTEGPPSVKARSFYTFEDGDTWPDHPIMWRPLSAEGKAP